MSVRYTFAELCRLLGKDTLYIRNLQRGLGLPIEADGYGEPYLRFMDKVVALRTFSVPMDRIRGLLDVEKKVLTLLHVDSLERTDTWFMESCCKPLRPGHCLLLSGYDIGFPIASHETGQLQHNLDFNQKDAELFSGAEMGEDIRRILRSYVQDLEAIRTTVEKEQTVLESALDWIAHTGWRD